MVECSGDSEFVQDRTGKLSCRHLYGQNESGFIIDESVDRDLRCGLSVRARLVRLTYKVAVDAVLPMEKFVHFVTAQGLRGAQPLLYVARHHVPQVVVADAKAVKVAHDAETARLL